MEKPNISLQVKYLMESSLLRDRTEALRQKAVFVVKALQKPSDYNQFKKAAIELFSACGLYDPLDAKLNTDYPSTFSWQEVGDLPLSNSLYYCKICLLFSELLKLSIDKIDR